MQPAIESRVPKALTDTYRLFSGYFAAGSKVFRPRLRSASCKEPDMSQRKRSERSEQIMEWRARQINDPVKRLRYLRQANRIAQKTAASSSVWVWPWRVL